MMDSEVYKLDCASCGRTITVPALDGEHHCPYCDAVLQIAWHAERATFRRKERRKPLR